MIEAALLTPILVVVTFAIVDFSVILYTWLALESGVSQATRYAVTGNARGGMDRQSSIKAAMRDATPTLTITDGMFSFSHMGPGGGAWAGGIGGPNDVERVTVTYPHDVLVLMPFVQDPTIMITVESTMKNEGF
jgi:TadE-like protein